MIVRTFNKLDNAIFYDIDAYGGVISFFVTTMRYYEAIAKKHENWENALQNARKKRNTQY